MATLKFEIETRDEGATRRVHPANSRLESSRFSWTLCAKSKLWTVVRVEHSTRNARPAIGAECAMRGEAEGLKFFELAAANPLLGRMPAAVLEVAALARARIVQRPQPVGAGGRGRGRDPQLAKDGVANLEARLALEADAVREVRERIVCVDALVRCRRAAGERLVGFVGRRCLGCGLAETRRARERGNADRGKPRREQRRQPKLRSDAIGHARPTLPLWLIRRAAACAS